MSTAAEKTYTLQTHLVTPLVVRALEHTIDFSVSGDRFKNLCTKIQSRDEYMTVELSTEETKLLPEALLRDMQNYVSVTDKTYHLKEKSVEPTLAGILSATASK